MQNPNSEELLNLTHWKVGYWILGKTKQTFIISNYIEICEQPMPRTKKSFTTHTAGRALTYDCLWEKKLIVIWTENSDWTFKNVLIKGCSAVIFETCEDNTFFRKFVMIRIRNNPYPLWRCQTTFGRDLTWATSKFLSFIKYNIF